MLKYLMLTSLLVVAAGCPAKIIGVHCSGNSDCASPESKCVAGLNSTPKICTHVCLNNADCPIGYDCAISDASLGKTCNKALYATDRVTGDPLLFGKACGPGDDTLCQGTGDLNPSPTCRLGNNPSEVKPVPLMADPAAYCTGSCTNDNDCPLPMKCAADYDGATKCLKRSVCDDCVYDENCGYLSGVFQSDFTACVPTADGTSHYCSKACATQKDCPGSSKGSSWMKCTAATDADGTQDNFCLHWYGACVGKGNLCDPCRAQSDCGTGLTCADNAYGFYSYPVTGERMCTKGCCAKFNQDGNGSLSCADADPDAACGGPNKSTCDYTSISTDTVQGVSQYICTGDPNHKHPGVFACGGF